MCCRHMKYGGCYETIKENAQFVISTVHDGSHGYRLWQRRGSFSPKRTAAA